MFQRKAGARADLHLMARGDGDGEAGRDRVARAGGQGHAFRRDHVQPRRVIARISGERQAVAMRQSKQRDLDLRPHRLLRR